MKITKIIATASVSCILFAAPAFAQSSATKAEDYAKDKVTTEAKKAAKEEVKDMATETSKEMLKPDNAMMIKGDPLTIETSSDVITADDAEVLIEGDVTMIEADDIMTKSKMIDVNDPVTTVVTACPEGTTAQDDGTCMITGDFAE